MLIRSTPFFFWKNLWLPLGGENLLDTLEKLLREDGTEWPMKPVKIAEVVMYVASPRWCSLLEERYVNIKTPSMAIKFGWRRNSRKKRRRRTHLVTQPTTAQVMTYACLCGSRSGFILSCRHSGLPTSFHLAVRHVL